VPRIVVRLLKGVSMFHFNRGVRISYDVVMMYWSDIGRSVPCLKWLRVVCADIICRTMQCLMVTAAGELPSMLLNICIKSLLRNFLRVMYELTVV